MTNVNINDLGITTVLENGDKLLVRKSGANYDTSITKENIAKSLGNTAAIGFIATSDTANKIILTPTNGAELDAYYDQMLITFVSPITSNAAVQVKIDGLAYKDILVNGNSIVVSAGDYIEAYFDSAFDDFEQSNNIESTQYTPEFTAVNSTVSGNTLITLTSAIGNHKTSYYNGMLITFINPANTLAGINVNVDGLGAVPLEVRTASGYIIPANTIVTAVYTTDRFVCNKSIQGTSLDLYGYVASSSVANQVQLNSVSGITGSNYVTGMRVSFVSPITTNAATQLKLPGMALKSFYKYGSTDNKPLVANNFYEAVYIGDAATGNFYETNATTDTIYTNEYTATAVIAGDESSTTYTLTSAIGIPKPAYYNAMSILFTSPVDSKGDQIVNVDGLGNKVLDDNDIQNEDINTGDAIMAIYDGTKFIKHRFATVEDPVPGPAPDIIVTVGTGGRFITIKAAIDGIIRDYGVDGNGQKILVQLLPGYEWNDSISIQNKLSWITIVSDINGNDIRVSTCINLMQSGILPNIQGTFTFYGNSFIAVQDGKFLQIIFENLQITNGNNSNNCYLILLVINSFTNRSISDLIQFKNCVINNFRYLFYGSMSSDNPNLVKHTIRNLQIIDSIWNYNQNFNLTDLQESRGRQFFIYGCNSYFSNNSYSELTVENVNLINSTFNFSSNTQTINCLYNMRSVAPFLYLNLNIETCIFQAPDNLINTISGASFAQITAFDRFGSPRYVNLLNCTMKSPKLNMQSLVIQQTANIKITGGNFINNISRYNAEIDITENSKVFLEKDPSGNYPIGNRQVSSDSTVTIIP